MAIEVKTKKWGNSIGIVIPNKIITKMKIKAGEDVVIEVEKRRNVLKELFGSLKFSKPTEELIKEARKDLESKWLK